MNTRTVLGVATLAFAFAVLKGLGFHRDLEPLLRSFMAPIGPRGPELAMRIVQFVDNVSATQVLASSEPVAFKVER